MGFIAVDLGSTNIKVAVYDDKLQMKAWLSSPVQYIREGNHVEFDATDYCQAIKAMIRSHINNKTIDACDVRQIVFTGQAESLVILGHDKKPLMNAISWMDQRSTEESELIAAQFAEKEIYKRTGQMAVLPTWPATKILWIKNNSRDIYDRAAHYVLLKDYIVYCLTGKLCADCSIATFTFYFDILNKCYWNEMLQACGIRSEQLPPLKEPCTNVGEILPSAADAMGLTTHTKVNVGTLDHFAGMIGTGNVHEGVISLSTGTVMALATLAPQPLSENSHTALHYGFIPDTYVFLPVAESGGICLEWFKKNFMKDFSYEEINRTIMERPSPNELLFLPYIVGTNAPEFDADACGVFFGIRDKHDEVDFAYAVMEGVAHMLAKNIDDISAAGTKVERIIATGGGAKSDIWCQIQADVTGVPVEIPSEKEAACLGAAMIGAVDDGLFESFSDAAQRVVQITKRFEPKPSMEMKRKHTQFNRLYKAMLEITSI